jgi:hypothetical protein
MRTIIDLMAPLLIASVLLGVPLALVMAWEGRRTVVVTVLGSMLAIAILGSLMSGFTGCCQGEHSGGYTMMFLMIFGPLAIAITAVAAIVAWTLWGRGEEARARQLELRDRNEGPGGEQDEQGDR